MKKRKLFSILSATLVTALTFGMACGSSLNATTTEAAASTTTEYNTFYVQHADLFKMRTDAWVDANDTLDATLTTELTTLKASYSKLELVKEVKAVDGVPYFINVTDEKWSSYVLLDGAESTTTTYYLLATQKNKDTRLYFSAPADMTASSLTFTKHNGTTTISLSDDLFDTFEDLGNYYFSTSKIKKYDCTAAKLTDVTNTTIKNNAKDWKTAPTYLEGDVYQCLKTLDDAGVDLVLSLKQNTWQKLLSGIKNNQKTIIAVVSSIAAAIVLFVIFIIFVKLFKKFTK